MLLQEFDSSTIKTVAYDKDEGKMWLRFQHGGLYEYRGVDLETVTNLIKAESKGHFFHECIKDKFTDFEKVEE
jgi:hypothetical protein